MLLKLNFKQWFSAPHVTGCLFVERKESWNAGAVAFPAEQLYLFTSPRSALRVPSAFTCAQLAVVREGPKNPWSGCSALMAYLLSSSSSWVALGKGV